MVIANLQRLPLIRSGVTPDVKFQTGAYIERWRHAQEERAHSTRQKGANCHDAIHIARLLHKDYHIQRIVLARWTR